MRRFSILAAVLASAVGAQAFAHGIEVGRTIQNRLAVIFEEEMPFELGESTFPGVPGFAEADPGFASLDAAAEDLFPLQELSEIEFVLTGADPGIQVWDDRGDAPLAIGETFYIGFPEFSVHPVWNIHDGQLGDVKSLTVQLRDRTQLAADSEPIVLEFVAVPEPSSALLGALGAALFARRRYS
jgi:hypothetical protein